MKRNWIFFLGVALLLLFAATSAFYLALQSTWGQNKILSILTEAIGESGWGADYESVTGALPGPVTLKKVSLVSPEGDRLTAGSIEVKLSLIHLLKKEIHFSRVIADDIAWSRETAPPPVASSASNGIPFSLTFSDLQLSTVHLPESNAIADMQGALKIGRHNKMAFLKILLTKRDAPDAEADITLLVRKNKQAQLNIDLEAPSTAFLAPWIELPVDGSGDLHFYVKGPYAALSELLLTGKASESLTGLLRANVTLNRGPAPLLRRWSLLSALESPPSGGLSLSNLSIKSDALQLKGRFSLDKSWQPATASLQLTLEDYAPLTGVVIAQLEMTEPNTALFNAAAHRLLGPEFALENARVQVRAEREENAWSATLDLSTQTLGTTWQGSSDLFYRPGQPLQIDDIQIQSSLLNLEGRLALSSDGLFVGDLETHISNLHDFNAFNPTWPLYGLVDASLHFRTADATQLLDIDATARQLFYKKLEIEQAYLHTHFTDFPKAPGGSVLLQLKRARFDTLFVEQASLQSIAAGDNWPVTFEASGDWKGPFELSGDGTCRLHNREFLCTLQDLSGSLFLHPLALITPAQLEMGRDRLRISGVELSIGNASLLAAFDHRGDATAAKLLLDRFPIDFLSINPLELSVTGRVNLDAQFTQTGVKTSGALNAQIHEIEIGALVEENSLSGNAQIRGTLADGRLALKTDLFVQNAPILQLKADLPLQATLYPPRAALLPAQNARADFSFNGRIEELLDFFDIGPQRLEGDVHAELHLSNTLNRPLLEGYCRLESGFYENYVSGAVFQNIQADLLAERQSIYLRSLTGQDLLKKGKLSLQGELKALWQEHFPFEIDGSFTRLTLANIDWINAEAGGSIHVVGNALSARVTGQAIVVETDLTIPERTPPNLPDLQVTYINAPKPIAVEQATLPRRAPYPLFFDYHIHAPDGIFVSGRGLNSEWQGDFQLGGTYTDLEAKGRLDLMTGEFAFSGRSFKLTEGSLTFSGKPHETPLLNVGASMNLQNIAILARLVGPLNEPHLSFTSIPPLPLGSIMSYMLFGEDLGEINPLQAAQLVTSISTLTSTGSSVLEDTKRALSVDRLRIIANPVGEEGAQTYALQVGKYVTRGVLVSVSQGAEQSSTNLSVEIDLVSGFVFQVESQREQEQGKFTVKWHYNY